MDSLSLSSSYTTQVRERVYFVFRSWENPTVQAVVWGVGKTFHNLLLTCFLLLSLHLLSTPPPLCSGGERKGKCVLVDRNVSPEKFVLVENAWLSSLNPNLHFIIITPFFLVLISAAEGIPKFTSILIKFNTHQLG